MSNCREQYKIKRPTKAQREAYKRLVQRDGWKNVSQEDAELLSTCQWLTVSQRQQLVAKVAAETVEEDRNYALEDYRWHTQQA